MIFLRKFLHNCEVCHFIFMTLAINSKMDQKSKTIVIDFKFTMIIELRGVLTEDVKNSIFPWYMQG